MNEKEKNIEQIVIYEEKNNMRNVKKFRRKLTTHTVIVIDIIWICGRFEYITEETTFKGWVFHTVLNASFLKFKIKFHFYFSDFPLSLDPTLTCLKLTVNFSIWSQNNNVANKQESELEKRKKQDSICLPHVFDPVHKHIKRKKCKCANTEWNTCSPLFFFYFHDVVKKRQTHIIH